MPEPKAQLVDPQGPIDVPGISATGIITATGGFIGAVQGAATGFAATTYNISAGVVTSTGFVGDVTGTASSVTKGTNLSLGIVTASSFAGDVFGNAAGLSTTTAGLKLGIVSATSFAGNFTGIGSGITGNPNIQAGIMTATSFAGNFTGLASGITGTPNLMVGILTGTSYSGDGSALTGIAATNWVSNNVPGSIFSINVTSPAGGNYTLSGTDRSGTVSGSSDPAVTVEIGDTLNFVVDASGHPFYIRVSDGGANVSTPAATNQGATDGTVSWTPNTAGTYYYQCGNHAGMLGTITVTATTTIDLSLGNVVKYTQSANTTVSFANTGTSNIVTFIRLAADYTLTWPSTIKWDSGSAPTLNTTSGETDVVTLLTRDEGVTWYGWETVNREFAVKQSAWVWGNNNKGILGQNNTTNYSSPVQLPGVWNGEASGGSANESTNDSAFLLKSDGSLWGMGADNKVVLSQPGGGKQRSSPVQVGSDTNWAGIFRNGKSSFSATKTDGTLWAWGANSKGNLGQNNLIEYSSPVQIPGTTWSTEKGKFAGADYITVAIKTDGTLWAWGDNVSGQLGVNDKTHRSSPTQIPGTTWKQFSGGIFNACYAIKTDGTLWSWGYNPIGALGHNDKTQRSSPTQIPGTTWSSVSQSYYQTALATKTDGTLWTWGMNYFGILGQNEASPGQGGYSSPVQIPGTSWDTTINGIAGLDYGAFARKTNGTIWAWGVNDKGQLGQNEGSGSLSSGAYSSPVQIPGTWDGIGALSGKSPIAYKNA